MSVTVTLFKQPGNIKVSTEAGGGGGGVGVGEDGNDGGGGCRALPGSRQYSVEVHHRDEDKVPGAQDTVNSLQLLVQVVVFCLKNTIRLSTAIFTRSVQDKKAFVCVKL